MSDILPTLAALLVATTTAACGGTPSISPDAGDADVDADRTDADAEPDADIDPGEAAGGVTLLEIETFGMYRNQAFAGFHALGGDSTDLCGVHEEPYGDACLIATVTGPTCEPDCGAFEVCVWQPGCSGGRCVPAGEVPLAPQAGTIGITGATHQESVVCTFGDPEPGAYRCDVDDADWWEPGDSLNVSAPGATFPAFSHSVVAPGAPVVITDLAAWTAADFSGDHDLAVDWETGASDLVLIVVIANDQVLECLVESGAGHFDIPAAGIAALGTPSDSWTFAINGTSRTLTTGAGGEGELFIAATRSGPMAVVENL